MWPGGGRGGGGEGGGLSFKLGLCRMLTSFKNYFLHFDFTMTRISHCYYVQLNAAEEHAKCDRIHTWHHFFHLSSQAVRNRSFGNISFTRSTYMTFELSGVRHDVAESFRASGMLSSVKLVVMRRSLLYEYHISTTEDKVKFMNFTFCVGRLTCLIQLSNPPNSPAQSSMFHCLFRLFQVVVVLQHLVV